MILSQNKVYTAQSAQLCLIMLIPNQVKSEGWKAMYKVILTSSNTSSGAQQQLMHFWICMVCILHHLCQLPPDEEDCDRDAENGLGSKQQQVLLGAGAVLALAHLESQEDRPQDQQLDDLHSGNYKYDEFDTCQPKPDWL